MIEDDIIELLHKVRPLDRRPLQIVPASEEELRRFERIHGMTLPGELKSWFRHCNGANVNPGGLESLFPRNETVCLDWHFKQYPAWKQKGWFPLGSDGCGDLYIAMTQITIPASGTHPICFLDQSDFAKPRYAVASGVWKFLYMLLQTQVLHDQGKEVYWPFSKAAVLDVDPALGECRELPLPWEIEDE